MEIKIKYAKAACQTILYILLVSVIYLGISKLSGHVISIHGLTLTIACSGILLHFMDKEDKAEE